MTGRVRRWRRSLFMRDVWYWDHYGTIWRSGMFGGWENSAVRGISRTVWGAASALLKALGER